METSILIAKIIALVYLSMGLGFILHPDYFKKSFDEMLDSSGFMIFGGIMALVFGFLMVNFHNIWVKDWTVIVTIIGWIGLIKGISIFLIPKLLISFSRNILKKLPMHVFGTCMMIFGVIMGYFGFFA